MPAEEVLDESRRTQEFLGYRIQNPMNENLEVHASSGNIFEDMGMRDAEERLDKAELARVIRKTIHDRKLTQAEAADILGAAQPAVSDLVRGKLSRFSVERLERFLKALDMEIRI